MISYGSVIVESPTAAQLAWVEQWISTKDVRDFAVQTWPGRQLTDIAFPPLTAFRPVKPQTLYWPVGASNFAVAYVVCTDVELTAIRQLAYTPTSMDAPFTQALTFTIGDGVQSVSTDLFMLPPRPISQIPTVIPGQTIPTSENGVWLLTLVDDRFFWWLASANIEVPSGFSLASAIPADGGSGYVVGDLLSLLGGTFDLAAAVTVAEVDGGGAILAVTVTQPGNYTVVPTNPVDTDGGGDDAATLIATWDGPWKTMFDLVATALGITLVQEVIPDAYLSPPVDLTTRYDSLALLLDAMAQSVGMRIVRQLDGTVLLQSARTANTNYLAQAGAQKLAGGAFLFDPINPNNDLPALLPYAVEVAFGLTYKPYPACPPYAKFLTLATLGLDIGIASTQNATKPIRSTCVPGYSTSGGSPLNQSELDDLAQQIATDFYNWQLGGLDIQFAGALNWQPEGNHSVEWDHSRFPVIMCRVQRDPWNDYAADLEHSGTYGSTWYTQIAAEIRANSAGKTGNFYDARLLTYDPTGDAFTDGQPVWLKDPGSSTIHVGDRFTGVLMGSHGGRPVYVLAGAATAGTSSLNVRGLDIHLTPDAFATYTPTQLNLDLAGLYPNTSADGLFINSVTIGTGVLRIGIFHATGLQPGVVNVDTTNQDFGGKKTFRQSGDDGTGTRLIILDPTTTGYYGLLTSPTIQMEGDTASGGNFPSLIQHDDLGNLSQYASIGWGLEDTDGFSTSVSLTGPRLYSQVFNDPVDAAIITLTVAYDNVANHWVIDYSGTGAVCFSINGTRGITGTQGVGQRCVVTGGIVTSFV